MGSGVCQSKWSCCSICNYFFCTPLCLGHFVALSLSGPSGHPMGWMSSLVWECLKMVLTMNNFDFAGRHYLQVGGTAMGTKVAPSFANTFMGWFEDIYVYTYHKQPHIWVRFIDDIFVIWLGSEEELHQFVEYLNNCLPSIKFEAEISTTSVNFLDVTVSITENGDIKTGLYTKPTDAHNYLSYQSCHPPTCRDSIPYSQLFSI